MKPTIPAEDMSKLHILMMLRHETRRQAIEDLRGSWRSQFGAMVAGHMLLNPGRSLEEYMTIAEARLQDGQGMRCRKHPEYKAIRRPTADCITCRFMYPAGVRPESILPSPPTSSGSSAWSRGGHTSTRSC